MKKIYLAGLISTEKMESILWRNQFAVRTAMSFESISPLRGKEDLGTRTLDGGMNSVLHTSKDIIRRDFYDVQRCDLVLVNLSNYGSPRPLQGTLFELAWAWQAHKPVVAFFHSEKDIIDADYQRYMTKHPFIIEAVSHYCDSLADSILLLRDYYL